MRAFAFATIGLFAVLLAWPLAAQDSAGQTVHRCVGQHGEIVFSGLPCAENGAADVAKPATEADMPAAFSNTCPASRDELRDRISIAVGRRDSNALAGLLRWSGVSGGAAKSRLRELAELTQRPLLGIDAGDETDASRGDDALRVRTGSNENGGVREHTFGVSADTGCYWLTW